MVTKRKLTPKQQEILTILKENDGSFIEFTNAPIGNFSIKIRDLDESILMDEIQWRTFIKISSKLIQFDKYNLHSYTSVTKYALKTKPVWTGALEYDYIGERKGLFGICECSPNLKEQKIISIQIHSSTDDKRFDTQIFEVETNCKSCGKYHVYHTDKKGLASKYV